MEYLKKRWWLTGMFVAIAISQWVPFLRKPVTMGSVIYAAIMSVILLVSAVYTWRKLTRFGNAAIKDEALQKLLGLGSTQSGSLGDHYPPY